MQIAASSPNLALTGPHLERDMDQCAAILRQGSKSFHAASRLLPRRIRPSVVVLYAFCRVADDAIDHSDGKHDALAALRLRLDGIYAGAPQPDPVDRALSAVVLTHNIPRAIWDGMLEGFQWDIEGRVYETYPDLLEYCARVASTVGAMVTLLMGERRHAVLARACDLGVAMQLTNIARDIGEDARAGRLYLPRSWMREQALDPEDFLARPQHSVALGQLVERLLTSADALYRRADLGIPFLPWDCRVAIRAARLIYSDIGTRVRAMGHDSVGHRAFTSGWRKLWLLLRSSFAVFGFSREPDPTPPLDEVRFIIDAIDAVPAFGGQPIPITQGAR